MNVNFGKEKNAFKNHTSVSPIRLTLSSFICCPEQDYGIRVGQQKNKVVSALCLRVLLCFLLSDSDATALVLRQLLCTREELERLSYCTYREG